MLAGLLFFASYIIAAHSLHAAATAIDDATGNMDDYAVLLCEGLTPPHESDGGLFGDVFDYESESGDDPAPSAEGLRAEYEEKGAAAFVLEADRLEKYADGVVFREGDCRFGVLSVTEFVSKPDFTRSIARFASRDVDFVVVLTTNMRYTAGLRGIDIVVSVKDEGLSVIGENRDGTFYVNVPESGQVGVVMVSPNGNVSAKVI